MTEEEEVERVSIMQRATAEALTPLVGEGKILAITVVALVEIDGDTFRPFTTTAGLDPELSAVVEYFADNRESWKRGRIRSVAVERKKVS